LASAKTLTNVLQCLNDSGQKDQLALCVISSDGLRVTVEDMGKCLQANVHFPPPLFDEFEFSEKNDCLEFRISLSLLLECLQIFGTANLGFTSVQMSCLVEEPETFNIILEEEGIVTECAISIQEGEESDIDYNATFRSSDELNKLIIKSDCLRDAFTELAETPGATSISVLISPTAPFFRLTADGSIGSCRIDFTKTSETFRHFQSDQEQEQRYKLTFLEMSLRGLSVAKETFLRMNEDGLLCVQHSVIEEGGHQFFMDFVLFPEDVEIE
jgi:cell cycle checkpoint protein